MNKFRKKLFQHLDGIVGIPTILVLNRLGILELIFKQKVFNIEDISKQIKINIGYFHISLRTLRSLNFIDFEYKQNKTNYKYRINNNFIEAYNSINKIQPILDLLPYHTNYINLSNKELSNYINKIINLNLISWRKQFSNNYYSLLEGIVIGPLLANIAFYRHLDISSNSIKIINTNDIFNNSIIKIFKKINFLDDKHRITSKGSYFFKKSSSYGVTVSYLNTFNNLSKILTTNPKFIWGRTNNGHEIHVNRSMNVWGSGGSHKSYFKKIDNIIIDIFNRDIDAQPKGIIDVGCGDGTFLRHMHDVIMTKTIRKNYIDTHPLILIGTDINQKARIASRETLNDLKAIIIYGNISKPTDINKLLEDSYGVKLKDFVNCRTFLDHNRVFKKIDKHIDHNIVTTGNFCYKGNLIQSDDLISNFISHIKSWKPYIKNFGLIIIELHTLDPEITRKNLGNTLACAYDATHGYSDQYLIEYEVFKKCLSYIDLDITKDNEFLYPSQMPTVSINYIK